MQRTPDGFLHRLRRISVRFPDTVGSTRPLSRLEPRGLPSARMPTAAPWLGARNGSARSTGRRRPLAGAAT